MRSGRFDQPSVHAETIGTRASRVQPAKTNLPAKTPPGRGEPLVPLIRTVAGVRSRHPLDRAWLDCGYLDQDGERMRKHLFGSNSPSGRLSRDQFAVAHGSTLTLSEDPSQFAAVSFQPSATRLRCSEVIQRAAARRVELIHRLATPSNLNSRDENDGIERRPDRFD